jgi:hypothetical protein
MKYKNNLDGNIVGNFGDKNGMRGEGGGSAEDWLNHRPDSAMKHEE